MTYCNVEVYNFDNDINMKGEEFYVISIETFTI